MKIEELMPQIRAGKKFRVAALDAGTYFYYIDNKIYTGFMAVKNEHEYCFDMPGNLMFRDDWELCDESIKSV